MKLERNFKRSLEPRIKSAGTWDQAQGLRQRAGHHRESAPKPPDLSGAWADIASLPDSPDKRCCFFDSTREGNPCPPDTLLLGADGSMRFTSLPVGPKKYESARNGIFVSEFIRNPYF